MRKVGLRKCSLCRKKFSKYPLGYTATTISCHLYKDAESQMSTTESCMQQVVSLTGKNPKSKPTTVLTLELAWENKNPKKSEEEIHLQCH